MGRTENETTVWRFLRGKGLPEKSVAAVMGNIDAESGFDHNKVEAGSGWGFGLCQWTNPNGGSVGRRTQLERYGITLDHQLNFLWAELSGIGGEAIGAKFEWSKKSAYLSHENFMKGNGSLNDLTSAFCFCWERPNPKYAHLDRRHRKATEYYNRFTGSTGSYTPGATANASVGSSEQVEMMTIEETNYQVIKGSEKRGDILFGRRYRITVSDESGTAIDISRLHCTFSIIKTIQMEPNSSEISVYNLNAQTENAIIMNGKRVTVEAGYEGSQFGLIFDGDIIQCIREKVNANTFKLTIIALDSDRAINFEIANYSILRGQSHRSIVEHIVNSASNPIPLGSISEKLNNTILPRGKVMFGKASDYLRQIAKSNDLKCYMDDGRLNMIDLKELPEDEIFKLDTTSGLVGIPEQTQYGVSGQCLLNPQIKLNSLIHIDNSLIRDKRIELGTSSAVPASVSTGDSGASTGTSGGQSSAGGYLIPYNGNFKITSHFGRRGGANHNGIDLGMPIGTPIFASKAGKVLKAGVDTKGINYGGGKIIMLEHPDGTATNYFHLDDWSVKTGDNVRQGQQIGLSGNTGGSTGPHLHFEIKEGGKYKDPIFVINGSGGNSAPPSVASANASVGGSTASSSSGASTGGSSEAQAMIRSLDKDGIYRVIKLEYQGDTRENDWYVHFETITQLGGAIPIVPV